VASQYESVMQAIKARLETITGGSEGYVYTPDAVQRVPFFPVDWMPDPTFQTLYVLHSSEPDTVKRNTSCQHEGRSSVEVIVMRRADVPSDNPSDGSAPVRVQITNDLVADAVKCILDQPHFGNTAIGILDDTLTIDRVPPAELSGYAWGMVMFTVRYQMTDGR
jgi:hypothetical protein